MQETQPMSKETWERIQQFKRDAAECAEEMKRASQSTMPYEDRRYRPHHEEPMMNRKERRRLMSQMRRRS